MAVTLVTSMEKHMTTVYNEGIFTTSVYFVHYLCVPTCQFDPLRRIVFFFQLEKVKLLSCSDGVITWIWGRSICGIQT